MEQEISKKIMDLSDRLYLLLAILIGVLVVWGLGTLTWQFASLPQNAPREISISGEGKVFAKPDVALVMLGVHSEASKSQDAVNQNNEKMNAVIKAIKDSGVNEKDIQTVSYSLNPVYGPSPEPRSLSTPTTP